MWVKHRLLDASWFRKQQFTFCGVGAEAPPLSLTCEIAVRTGEPSPNTLQELKFLGSDCTAQKAVSFSSSGLTMGPFTPKTCQAGLENRRATHAHSAHMYPALTLTMPLTHTRARLGSLTYTLTNTFVSPTHHTHHVHTHRHAQLHSAWPLLVGFGSSWSNPRKTSWDWHQGQDELTVRPGVSLEG